MADLVIKPTSGNLIIKDDQNVARLTIAPTSGATTLSNVTAGTLGSGVTFPTGHVLQVIHASTTTETVCTGGYEATALTATITPRSTSSKVLIIIGANFMTRNTSNNDGLMKIKIYSNGGAGGNGSGTFAAISDEQTHRGYDYGGSGLNINTIDSINWLDSPSLTVPVTYKLYIKMVNGTDVRLNDGGSSTINLLEVAG